MKKHIPEKEILRQLLQNNVWIIRYLIDMKVGAIDQTNFSGIIATKDTNLMMLNDLAKERPLKKRIIKS